MRCRRLLRLAREHYHISEKADAFMTLSFLALPVIPRLKITARGLLMLMRSDSFRWVRKVFALLPPRRRRSRICSTLFCNRACRRLLLTMRRRRAISKKTLVQSRPAREMSSGRFPPV